MRCSPVRRPRMGYSLFLTDLDSVSYFLYYQQCCSEVSSICLPTHTSASLFICLEVELWVTRQHFLTLLPHPSPEQLPCFSSLSRHTWEFPFLPIFSTTWHVKALDLGQFEGGMTFEFFSDYRNGYFFTCLRTMRISHTVNFLFIDFAFFFLLGCLILLICKHVF